MRQIAIAGTLCLLLSSAALAQTSQQPKDQGVSNAPIQQQVKQNLSQAGFTNIQVLPESFLVRATDKSGNPVMMIINPDSLTAVTALGSQNNQSGSNSTGKNTKNSTASSK